MPDPYEEITYGPLDAPKKIKLPQIPLTHSFAWNENSPLFKQQHYFVKHPNVYTAASPCHVCHQLIQYPVHYDEGIPYDISAAAVGMTIWIPRKLLYPPKVMLMPDNLPVLTADEGHEVVDWVLKKYQWAEYTITSMPGAGPKFPKTVSISGTTIFYVDTNMATSNELKFQLEMEQAMIPLTKEDFAKAFDVPISVLDDVPVDIPVGPMKNHPFVTSPETPHYCAKCGHYANAAVHSPVAINGPVQVQVKPLKKGKSNHPYAPAAVGYSGCQICGQQANSAVHMAPHPSGIYDEVSDKDVSDKLTQMAGLSPKQEKVLKSLKKTPVSINDKGEVTTDKSKKVLNHPYKNPAGEYGPCTICGFAPISEIHGEPFGKVQNVHVAGEYPGIVASSHSAGKAVDFDATKTWPPYQKMLEDGYKDSKLMVDQDVLTNPHEPGSHDWEIWEHKYDKMIKIKAAQEKVIHPIPGKGNWRTPHKIHLHDSVGTINDDCADCQLLKLMDGKLIGFTKTWRALGPGKEFHPVFTALSKALEYKQKHPEVLLQVSWRSDWVEL